jgi:hypothetical protein
MFTFTALNARRIITDLRRNGRRVDMHIALIIFRKFYKNAIFSNLSMTQICEQFRADLWNYGAIA